MSQRKKVTNLDFQTNQQSAAESPRHLRKPLTECSKNTPMRALFKGEKKFSERIKTPVSNHRGTHQASLKTPKKENKKCESPYKEHLKSKANHTTIKHSALKGASNNTPKTAEEISGDDSASIKVAVRVRPFNSSEVCLGLKNAISMDDNITCLRCENGSNFRFTFDHSLWSFDSISNAPFVSQKEIYMRIAKPLLHWSFEGYNTCLFAYGQTGSGKSYTMMGYNSHTDRGIIPRFSQNLFDEIDNRESKAAVQYSAQISFYEIYNEKIFDLFSANDGIKQRLCVREHPELGPYVQGLAQHNVGSHTDILDWLEVGNKNRATACTGMNDKSSRSHSVFTIVLSQVKNETFEGTETQLQRSSKINLIDLAGSERSYKVLDDDVLRNCAETAATRLKEGGCINKSLHTLGKVISLLSEMQLNLKRKPVFIPYRDSVLTWLLKESLGGNAKTTMLATLSPADIHAPETLSTLRYASQARSIVNKAKVNEDPKSQLIREMLAEIAHLKAYQRRSGCNTLENEVVCLRHKLRDAQQELAIKTKNWQDDLLKSNADQKTAAKHLRRSGVTFLRVDNNHPSLVNLNEDPQLAEVLLYMLKEGKTLVGKKDIVGDGHICLKGDLVAGVHCKLYFNDDTVSIVPVDEAPTYVNGALITEETVLHHGDRIVIGGDHFFRLSHPIEAKRSPSNNPDLKDFEYAKSELQQKQNERLENEIEQARLQAEEESMERIKRAQMKAEADMASQRKYFEEQLDLLQKRLDASSEEKELACKEEKKSQELIVKLKSQKKQLEEEISSNKERLQAEACEARLELERTKEHQGKIIEELEMRKKRIQDDIDEMKENNGQTRWRTSISLPVNQSSNKGDGEFDLLKISMMIREANEVCKRLKQHFVFTRDDFCVDGEVKVQIRVCDRSVERFAIMSLPQFALELEHMKDLSLTDHEMTLTLNDLEWHHIDTTERSMRLSVSNQISVDLIDSLNCTMELATRKFDKLLSASNPNHYKPMHMPMESSRLSTLSNQPTDNDYSMLRSTFIDTMLVDVTNVRDEVSILSSLTQRVFHIYTDLNSQCTSDVTLMNVACNLRGLKESASMLCSVHEAVGLDDLKKMSRLFKKLVTDASLNFKVQSIENSSRSCLVLNERLIRMVEVAGALSLAAVDYVSGDDDESMYFAQGAERELCTSFLRHQNKFLVSMFDESEHTIENGIRDIRVLQIDSTHEMPDDLVDDVMNVFTSCATMLNRGRDYLMVYADVSVASCDRFFAKECFIMRKMLTSAVDFNECIHCIRGHCRAIAGDCDLLEEFIEVPIELADALKCMSVCAKQLTSFVVLTKNMEEETNAMLRDCMDKFDFAGKAARVGVTILLQDIEKDLNVSEERSVVSLVQSDFEFERKQAMCPLNRSSLDVSSQLEGRLGRVRRGSSVSRDVFISRYMEATTVQSC